LKSVFNDSNSINLGSSFFN